MNQKTNGLRLLTNSMDPQKETDQDIRHCLMFKLADGEYGIDMLCIKEIKILEAVTRLPNSPNYIQGVFNFHGDIVPVVNLRLILGLPQQDSTSATVTLVLKLDSAITSRLMAVVVDEVLEPLDIAGEDIKPVPDFGSEIETSLIHGLVSIDDKVRMILNVEQLLYRDALG